MIPIGPGALGFMERVENVRNLGCVERGITLLIGSGFGVSPIVSKDFGFGGPGAVGSPQIHGNQSLLPRARLLHGSRLLVAAEGVEIQEIVRQFSRPLAHLLSKVGRRHHPVIRGGTALVGVQAGESRHVVLQSVRDPRFRALRQNPAVHDRTKTGSIAGTRAGDQILPADRAQSSYALGASRFREFQPGSFGLLQGYRTVIARYSG